METVAEILDRYEKEVVPTLKGGSRSVERAGKSTQLRFHSLLRIAFVQFWTNVGDSAKQAVRVIWMLPSAANRAKRAISEALAGGMRAPLKARALLREDFGGEIVLEPREGGQLWTTRGVNRAAALMVVGTSGSGGESWASVDQFLAEVYQGAAGAQVTESKSSLIAKAI